MCPPMWAHWRHLANTIELVLPSAHPSTQLKRQIDWFSQFLHSSWQILYNGYPFPPKLPLSIGIWTPHLTHDCLGPSEPTTQMASLLVKSFLRRWLQSVPMLYNGTPLSPSKLPLPMRGSALPSNIWFPVLTRVLIPNGISIGSAVFAGLTSMTDRLTNHATRSVTTGHIYVRSVGDAA